MASATGNVFSESLSILSLEQAAIMTATEEIKSHS
jgi:hypothetical protein